MVGWYLFKVYRVVSLLITENRLLLSQQSLWMVTEEPLDDPPHHYFAVKHLALVDVSGVVLGNGCWATCML